MEKWNKIQVKVNKRRKRSISKKVNIRKKKTTLLNLVLIQREKKEKEADQ